MATKLQQRKRNIWFTALADKINLCIIIILIVMQPVCLMIIVMIIIR